MNKAAVRLKVISLIDDNCVGCDQRMDSNSRHCWTKCEIGKELNTLGTYLGGTRVEGVVKIRTTKDWDKICKRAFKMRQKGMTYKEIAKKLGVKQAADMSTQLKKRGLR